MAAGKYQTASVRKPGKIRYKVYSIIDGDIVGIFNTIEEAQRYADKLNGKD